MKSLGVYFVEFRSTFGASDGVISTLFSIISFGMCFLSKSYTQQDPKWSHFIHRYRHVRWYPGLVTKWIRVSITVARLMKPTAVGFISITTVRHGVVHPEHFRGIFQQPLVVPLTKNIVISNKLLNKLSTCRWFETLIWRHCNAIALCYRSYLRWNWRALRLSYCYDVGRSVPGHCSVVVIVRTKYLDCHPCVRSSVRLDCVIWLPKFPVILPKFYRCSTNCVLRVPYKL